MIRDKTVGKLAWHVHHDWLCEALTEPLEVRIDYIWKNKSRGEIERRLKLLKLVEGPLPDVLKDARAKWDAVQEEWDSVQEDWHPVRLRWHFARTEWNWAVNEVYKSSMLELHNKECPSCPWNGSTIFPEEE